MVIRSRLLLLQHPFDKKSVAHGRVIDEYMRHSPYKPTVLQNGTAGHALHDVAGLWQQTLVRDPQHHTALGGEDWRVTSTISMAYSCMEAPSTVQRMEAGPVWTASLRPMGSPSG